MTTFIKTKFNISDYETNIDKYRLAVSITEYLWFKFITANHYYKLVWSSESFEIKFNIGFGIPIEFPSERKNIIQIGT